jgi:hypothetical protein
MYQRGNAVYTTSGKASTYTMQQINISFEATTRKEDQGGRSG